MRLKLPQLHRAGEQSRAAQAGREAISKAKKKKKLRLALALWPIVGASEGVKTKSNSPSSQSDGAR